jgi:glucosamine-6-phosphate isomerase
MGNKPGSNLSGLNPVNIKSLMEKLVYPDYQTLSVETARMIARIISNKPDALLCFPAGETSLGTFEELTRLSRTGKLDFSQCKIVGLDEWVHLGEMKKENCYHFLHKHLFGPIGKKSDRICFFNGEAADPESELELTDQFISLNGGIDLMLLGLGMNGHLGLNEPGTSFDTGSHTVELDEVTKRIGQKYFSGETVLSRGITLGLKQVLEARTVILQVSGSKKANVVKHLIETEVSTAFPASIIKQHPNAFLLLDAEAVQIGKS